MNEVVACKESGLAFVLSACYFALAETRPTSKKCIFLPKACLGALRVEILGSGSLSHRSVTMSSCRIHLSLTLY